MQARRPTLGEVPFAIGWHAMPIFRFVAIAGGMLLALLFVADATLAPRGPLFTNQSEGLPRSQPIQPQEAASRAEPARPRAPALVQLPPAETAAGPSRIVAPPAEVAEVVTAAAPVGADAVPASPNKTTATEPDKVEPAKAESATTEIAKLDGGTEAATRPSTAAPQQKTRKPASKADRPSRYAAYRDRAPTVENGHAYGVPFRRERSEQRRPWDSDFSQQRWRF
jgi:hypothetical protein